MRRTAAAMAIGLVAAACAGGGRVRFETRAVTMAGGDQAASAGGTGVTPGGLLPTATTAPPSRTGSGVASHGGAGTGTGGAGGAGGGDGGGAAEIKLGTVLPLQGGQRDWGEPVLRTTQAFIDELNARGGVNGHRLSLVAYSACLVCQDDALAAVRRLVEQDQVFALVNAYPMAVAFQPVIPYLVSKGVPLVQGGAENQTTDALSPINIATAPSGLFYVNFLTKMASRYAGLKRIAITYLDVPSETNGMPLLERALARDGVQVVDKEPLEAAEDAVTNMDSAVIRMRAKGADGVLSTNPVLLVYGRLAAARQGWGAKWVGEAAWSQLALDACGSTCDDLLLTDTAGLSFPDRDTPQMHQYLDTMRRRYPGGQLTGHTLAAWVGMQLTVEILSRLHTVDRAAFVEEMNRITNLDLGTTSVLTLDPDRHLGGSASVLLRFKDGAYVRASDPLAFGEASRS